MYQEQSLNLRMQGVMDVPFLYLRINRERLISDSYDNVFPLLFSSFIFIASQIASVRIGNPLNLKKQLKVEFEGSVPHVPHILSASSLPDFC